MEGGRHPRAGGRALLFYETECMHACKHGEEELREKEGSVFPRNSSWRPGPAHAMPFRFSRVCLSPSVSLPAAREEEVVKAMQGSCSGVCLLLPSLLPKCLSLSFLKAQRQAAVLKPAGRNAV